MSQYQDLKQACYDANMQLPKLGLVLFTFGNASVVDREKRVFAIKPSGVPYEVLKPEDIVVLDFANHVLEGEKRPSSDTKTHAVLYSHWEHIGGIVHTHSTYATAWAQAQLDIPILGTTHADHLTADVPCAPPMDDAMIAGDYEHQTGWQILNEFQRRGLSPTEVEMVLLANHAPFTWGKTVEKSRVQQRRARRNSPHGLPQLHAAPRSAAVERRADSQALRAQARRAFLLRAVVATFIIERQVELAETSRSGW